jgi:hypothetical protein
MFKVSPFVESQAYSGLLDLVFARVDSSTSSALPQIQVNLKNLLVTALHPKGWKSHRKPLWKPLITITFGAKHGKHHGFRMFPVDFPSHPVGADSSDFCRKHFVSGCELPGQDRNRWQRSDLWLHGDDVSGSSAASV